MLLLLIVHKGNGGPSGMDICKQGQLVAYVGPGTKVEAFLGQCNGPLCISLMVFPQREALLLA